MVGVVMGEGYEGKRDGKMEKIMKRFGGVDNGKEENMVEMEKKKEVNEKMKKDVVEDMIEDKKIEKGDGGYKVN